jgi:hypothetical protein
MTAGMVSNEDMLRGLYHGTWQGLQFASPLAFTPIQVPVNMMGVPTPKSDDGATQAALDLITLQMADGMTKLHRSALLVGTAWRWPRYDRVTSSLIWEPIPDPSVCDVLADVNTGAVRAVLTDESIILSVAQNVNVSSRRYRRFDRDAVSVRWEGSRPEGAEDYRSVNVSGALPIPFAHDADELEVRGHSALSRMIRDLKDYHDIDYMRSEILTKFRPKQLQEVDDVGKWMQNNLGTDSPEAITGYDVAGNDLILNRHGMESTEFAYLPEGATAPHEKALATKYLKIFEGSGIPEMFWGGLATGNHATAEVQMQQAVSYVDQVRRQFTQPYKELYSASLRLVEVATMSSFKPFTVKWNDLESVSADVKSQVFGRFAQAVAAMAASGTITKDQVRTLWEMNYPSSRPGDKAEFEAGIKDMAQFQQFLKMDYFSGLSDRGGDR